jgi:intracellular sulfur oxidation DsrE/DsrF family protein
MNAPRRGFLSHVSLGVLAAVALPHSLAAAKPPVTLGANEPWLEGLSGRHKQFFDVAVLNGGKPLVRAASFLDGYGQSYGLEDADLNIIFGAHGSALALVLNDATWSKYRLGDRHTVEDPSTRKPATRNLFSGLEDAADGFKPSVMSLQNRGVRFIACMQTIARLSRELATQFGEDEREVRHALLGGLLSGVIAVPAMIIAANRAQERGLTYVYIG